ncbi:hypothetical protein SLS55_005630 [Diplodia seriata]|uniref:Uncharacterized protein n=1 Tax=Diplodia seriata TaxID=420778 RepID=A0ABR3CGX9_9PEZI
MSQPSPQKKRGETHVTVARLTEEFGIEGSTIVRLKDFLKAEFLRTKEEWQTTNKGAPDFAAPQNERIKMEIARNAFREFRAEIKSGQDENNSEAATTMMRLLRDMKNKVGQDDAVPVKQPKIPQSVSREDAHANSTSQQSFGLSSHTAPSLQPDLDDMVVRVSTLDMSAVVGVWSLHKNGPSPIRTSSDLSFPFLQKWIVKKFDNGDEFKLTYHSPQGKQTRVHDSTTLQVAIARTRNAYVWELRLTLEIIDPAVTVPAARHERQNKRSRSEGDMGSETPNKRQRFQF